MSKKSDSETGVSRRRFLGWATLGLASAAAALFARKGFPGADGRSGTPPLPGPGSIFEPRDRPPDAS